jgi:hypothetical protein
MGRDLLCAWQARTAGETLNSQEAKAVFPMNQLKGRSARGGEAGVAFDQDQAREPY